VIITTLIQRLVLLKGLALNLFVELINSLSGGSWFFICKGPTKLLQIAKTTEQLGYGMLKAVFKKQLILFLTAMT